MSRRAWLLFVAMAVLWGLPYLFIKVAVAEIEPLPLVFARLAISAAVLIPIAAATGSLQRAWRHWRLLLLVALVGIVLPFLLIAYGEQHITSSLAALLIAADPLFIALLALRLDASERASGTRLIGLIVGLLGVAVLLGLDVGGDAMGILGGALVLLAAVCYALSALMVKRLAAVPQLGSVAITLAMASVVLLPPAVFSLPSRLPTLQAIGSVVALGLLCTAVAYVIYFRLILEAGATRASLVTYFNPAVAVLLGVLILSEPFTPGTVVGFVLIVTGCALSTDALGDLRRVQRARRIAGAASAEGRSF